MTLTFRNVTADPDDAVETWPLEALATVIDRGSVRDLARITRVIRRDPWGQVARSVASALQATEPSGATALLERAIDRARSDADRADREAVAREVRELIASSGLTARQFALRAGTSPSRLSTYASGSVVPSALLMRRMRRVAETTGMDALDEHREIDVSRRKLTSHVAPGGTLEIAGLS